MGNKDLEKRDGAAKTPAVPVKNVEAIPAAENHANYLVDKITASSWIRDLGKNGKIPVAVKAAIAYAVAATLEELHASDRRYRVADLSLFARIATYFSPELRPVSISVSSTSPEVPSEKKGGLLSKLGWSEYALVVTLLCTAGAIFYAQYTTGQTAGHLARITSLEGLLSDSNLKRDEYAERLVQVNRYLGQLEGQADAQSEQQKKMLTELKSLVGKVDKVIQDNTKSKGSSKTDSSKK